MAINRKPCALCMSPMEDSVLPTLLGNEESCCVTLSNVPIMVCAKGHKRLLYSHFVMELMDVLARPETAGMQVAEKHGMFRKRFHCTKCGAEIPTKDTSIAAYKATIKLSHMTDSISVALTAPVMRCGACGSDQFADESGLLQLFKALSHAFRSADVRPQ